MTNAWALPALWMGLALVTTLLAIWFKVAIRFKVSMTFSEVVVCTVAQLIICVIYDIGRLQSAKPTKSISWQHGIHTTTEQKVKTLRDGRPGLRDVVRLRRNRALTTSGLMAGKA